MIDVFKLTKYIFKYYKDKDYFINNFQLQKILYIIYIKIKKEYKINLFKEKIILLNTTINKIIPKIHKYYFPYGCRELNKNNNLYNANLKLNDNVTLSINKILDYLLYKDLIELLKIEKENSIYYAGIGSRKTPKNIMDIMYMIGQKLADEGYILRSGGAKGADMAFESGCNSSTGIAEIFLPWPNFNNNKSILYTIPEEAYTIASKYHPNWNSVINKRIGNEKHSYVEKLMAP